MNTLNDRFIQSKHIMTGSPMIVSILSGKGGVGKSVIALNLSERLASFGKKTLLVDADPMCGNQHILANIGCESESSAFYLRRERLSSTIIEIRKNLDLLSTPDSEQTTMFQSVSETAQLISRLRKVASQYAFVIFDHASGISDAATALAFGSDLTAVVMIPEITSVADAYGLIKHLRKTAPGMDCRLLLNRTSSDQEAAELISRFDRISLRFLENSPKVLGKVSEDNCVRLSVASQYLLADHEVSSDALEDISNLAREIISLSTLQQIEETSQRINKSIIATDTRG